MRFSNGLGRTVWPNGCIQRSDTESRIYTAKPYNLSGDLNLLYLVSCYQEQPLARNVVSGGGGGVRVPDVQTCQ
jgi:hypothetical protein